MIETIAVARAQAMSLERRTAPRWSPPRLPRGPSALTRLKTAIAARVRALGKPGAPAKRCC